MLVQVESKLAIPRGSAGGRTELGMIERNSRKAKGFEEKELGMNSAQYIDQSLFSSLSLSLSPRPSLIAIKVPDTRHELIRLPFESSARARASGIFYKSFYTKTSIFFKNVNVTRMKKL